MYRIYIYYTVYVYVCCALTNIIIIYIHEASSIHKMQYIIILVFVALSLIMICTHIAVHFQHACGWVHPLWLSLHIGGAHVLLLLHNDFTKRKSKCTTYELHKYA